MRINGKDCEWLEAHVANVGNPSQQGNYTGTLPKTFAWTSIVCTLDRLGQLFSYGKLACLCGNII